CPSPGPGGRRASCSCGAGAWPCAPARPAGVRPCSPPTTTSSTPCPAAAPPRARGPTVASPEEGTREVRDFLRAPAPTAVGRGRRAPAAQGRARPDPARGRAGLRLRLGGRAPLPGGVLALLRARGVPRRRQPAHLPHPPRPRHRDRKSVV